MQKQDLIAPLQERIRRSGLTEPRIAVLVSGGVDSSVVVHLLTEAGYHPTLFYIQIGMEEKGFTDCSWEDDLEIVRHLAHRYDCPLEVVSLHDEYWANVVQYTIDTVRRGLTPNPDMMCNKLIKFGCFEEKWGKDFDFIATGHYATTTFVGDQLYLATAPDPVKDQTDFLAQINFRQVSKLLFPTGHLLKSEVRRIAEEAHLLSANRKDSQGICFLGKVNYNEFIERALGQKEGLIIERETGKILGKHKGYWFHTIGQRKGLGLSGGPWFVVKKNIRRNIILVTNTASTSVWRPATSSATTLGSTPPRYAGWMLPSPVRSRWRLPSRCAILPTSHAGDSPTIPPRATSSRAKSLSKALPQANMPCSTTPSTVSASVAV